MQLKELEILFPLATLDETLISPMHDSIERQLLEMKNDLEISTPTEERFPE